jgi:uncharacterized protein (DUF1684 family)
MKTTFFYRSLATIGIACLSITAATLDSAYRAEIDQWRQQREAALRADGGWLTVTGLFWLKEGANSLGSGPENDILLPESAPASLGIVKVEKGSAVFTAVAPSVTLNGKPVHEAAFHYAGPADVLSTGPLDLLLLKRGDRLAVRLKDKNSALRKNFTHLSWYPVSEDWKITGKFVALPAPAKLVLDSIIGEQEIMQTPGYVEFQYDGQTYKLQAVSEGKRLFFVIRDQTSGRKTYAAARFLYADPPKEDGTVLLDFNKAQNPPCAFTAYATCPLPPPQNRLSLAIEAGEQKYEGSVH